MVRALFTEVRWSVSGLGLALAALVPGMIVLEGTEAPAAIAWGLIVFGSVAAVTSLGSLYFAITGFLERRRNSVTILDAWYCYYRKK